MPNRFLILFFAVAFATPALRGQTVSGVIDTQKSELSYTGDHPLHKWTGVSRAVTGSVHLDPGNPSNSRVEIIVPVESFDSGNDNRDSNMMDVVEVERYPRVRFVSTRIESTSWTSAAGVYSGQWIVHGALTFHGQTHPIVIPTDVTWDGATFRSTGSFSIQLGRFKVKRPKLLLRPISNEIVLVGNLVASLSASP